MKKVLLVVSLLILLAPGQALAKVGVGIGTGKITVTEPLQAGGIYTLPSVVVFNTGDEAAVYSMYITLNETQDEYKPNPDWFSFSPQEFTLEPKQSQTVIPTFSPPLVAQAGQYYGYLEARPSRTVKQGNATIGVAAATKLRFELRSSNVFIGLWHRLRDLYLGARPWSYIATAAIFVALMYRFLKDRFQIQVVKKPKKKDSSERKNDSNSSEEEL